MANKLSGGGIQSNKLVRPNVRTGQPYKATSAAAASQLGQSTSFNKEQVERGGRAYTGSPLGNELALNVGKGGPGTGRTVHHCGSQGQHGSPNRGEAGIVGTADRGPRAILGGSGSKP